MQVVDTLEEKSDETSIQNNIEELQTPYVGMLFETLEEARNFYEKYGRQEGFWIRIRSSSRTKYANERSELLRRGAIGKGVIGNGTREEELLRRSDRNEELLRRGALGDGFDGDDIADQILI
ncbi:hypothetical protein LWI28_006042 [Acer negundo]|uniref:Uncharacterized protein n=1 Tax=Acer negundo TaxID=4023 RepID=A0AAD5IKR6_ACENE|nr:hypothetical protein LWI28_006042 [Acer negundo]